MSHQDQDHDIGYAHDHLAAIEQGMPVFDNDNHQVGHVNFIQFAHDTLEEDMVVEQGYLQKAPDSIRTQLMRAGFIKVGNDNEGVTYCALGSQIRFVNEGVVQLNVPTSELLKL